MYAFAHFDIELLTFRPHTSLNGYSPFLAHFSSHAASEIARYQSGRFKRHQTRSFRMFMNTPDKQFSVNDRVLIRQKPHAFQKLSPIFYPSYEADVYRVTHIDRKFLPYKHIVQNTNNTSITKQLYAFEMVKLGHNNENLVKNSNPVLSNPPKQIHVADVVLQDPSRLRSGKLLPGKATAFYRIKLNNEEEIVSEKGLRVLLKSVGPESISYSPFFSSIQNQKYIIN